MTTHKVVTKIATYNINGVLNPIKRTKVLNKMNKERVEVVFLQETHLTQREHVKLKRKGYNQIFASSYKKGHRRGVAILVSGKISFEKLYEINDKEGRFILVRGRLEGVSQPS